MAYDTRILKVDDIDFLKDELQRDASFISIADDEWNTPLHLARDPEAVRLLLKHGADVNARNTNGFTPLHLAPATNIIRLLLKAGANPNAATASGITPLCLVHTREQARLLIEAGANVHGNTFTTPLHHARTVEIARYLISQGADVNTQDRFGQTPIFTTPSAVLQFLLTQGAEPDWNDLQGKTPLFYAPDQTAAKLLLEHGADVNHIARSNITPVEYVTSKEVIRLLVRHGGHVSTRRRNELLHEVNDPELLELYFKAKAKVNAFNGMGQTALHTVKNLQCASLLLKHGACINQQDSRGRTPVFYVSTPDILLLYLEHGADLQVCDKEGATPLHYAKNPEIIRLLLSRGLSVHARDLQGNTPFHYQFRNLSAARILLEHGADVNSRNNIGVAPVHRVRNVKELAFLYYHGADLSVTIQGTSIFYLNDDPAIQQFIRNHRIPVQARRTSEEPEEAESSEQDEFLPLQEYAQRIPPDLLAVIDSGDNTYFQIMLEIYATNESLKPLFYYLFLNKKYDLCETLVKSSNFHQVLKDEFKPILLKRQQETGIRKLLQFF